MSFKLELKKIPNARGVAGAKTIATEAATIPKVNLDALPIFLFVTDICCFSQVGQNAICGSLPNTGGVIIVGVTGFKVSESDRLNLGGKRGELMALLRNCVVSLGAL